MVLSHYGLDGARSWTRSWQWADDASTWADAVAVAPGGAVYVAGTVGGGPGVCDTAWFLLRYGSNGRFIWHRRQPTCDASGASGVAASDRSVVLIGHDWADGFGTTDGWMRSYSPTGTLRWTRGLRVPGYGVDPYTRLDAVAVGSGGASYVGGALARRVDAPDFDAVLQKVSPTGAIVWSRTFPDAGPPDGDTITSLSTQGNTLMVAGIFERVGWSRFDVWIASYGLEGHMRWARHEPTWRHRRYWRPAAPSIDLVPGGGSVAVWDVNRAEVRTLVISRLTAGGATRWGARIPDAQVGWPGSGGSVSADRISIVVGGRDRSSGQWRDRIWRFVAT